MKYTLEDLKTLFIGTELEKELRSIAIQNLIDISNNPESRDCLTANKLLAMAFWKDVEQSKRGAPSKEDVRYEASRILGLEKQLLEDYKRIEEKDNGRE